MAADESDATRAVETRLESTLESVDKAETLVLQAAEKAGFPEEDLHKLGMAVRESMVNAVVHGNRYNLRKSVHLSVTASPERLEIVITDEGEGFDRSELSTLR